MTWKIFICLTLLLGCFFYGQNVTVKDSLTLIPLENVLIQTTDGYETLIKTNHLGKATIPVKEINSIRFSLDGYKVKTTSVKDLFSQEDNVILLDNTTFKLTNVIITGTNWKTKTKNLAAHVISLTASEIKDSNQSTTADLLQETNEVFIQKSQLGGGSPMLRGFATNRLLIAVDGINMNNAIFRSGNLQNIIAIDPFTIQKVEVLTGPSSVIYGSDALGGVLSFKTNEVLPSTKFEFMGEANLRYATATQEKSAHIDIDLSNKHWASISSISFTKFGDAKMGKHGPDEYLRNQYVIREDGADIEVNNENPLVQKHTAYHQLNLLQKVLYKFNEELSITGSVMYSKTSYVPRYDRLQQRRDGRLKVAEWYYGPQEWVLSNVQSDYAYKTKFFNSWKSILSHQYFTESRHSRNFNANWKYNRYERVNLWSWQNSFYKELNNNKLLYGFDLRMNHVNSRANKSNIVTQETSKITSRYPDGSDWNQFGIYGKYLMEFDNHALNMETGLRYSYVNASSKFDNEFYEFPFTDATLSTSALTGSIGFNYKPLARLKFNAYLSTGFRAPNIDDIAKIFDSEPGNIIVPNPDLKPEYIYSGEAGIAYSLNNILFLNVLGYYSWLEDALVRRDFTFNGQSTIEYDGEPSQVQAIQNASQAKIYGGLFQMEYNISRTLKLLGKINYVHGEEELKDGSTTSMRHITPLFGNISMEAKWKKLKFIIDYDFNGKVKAENLPQSELNKSYLYALNHEGMPFVPDIHVFNFSTQFRLNDFITTQFRIDNILDRRYRPYSSGISAPGRNFVFSIRTIY